ncbi:hypothetical protein [Streptomyces sp. CA-132043]|uniref:hypothetical protein n=1 Tax=Streptomyces sp. CA-132043 TaxID=3240048 RepID=UPI003D8E409B
MSLGDDGAYGGGEYSGQGPGQTRTRLPGGEGDVYGSGRRSRGGLSSRNLVTIVGVVVLLIAAIAFANRGGSGSGSDSTDGDSGAPAAQPTAPTGQRPVSGKNSDTPTIPSGFPKSEQGAQSAAANYAVALGSSEMFKEESRKRIVRSIHDPAVVDRLENTLDKAYSPAFLKNVGLNADGSAPKDFTFVSRTVPVGTKVSSLKGGSATVEVWCTGLVGLAGEGSTDPVSDTWFTITQKLRWIDGDWKIETSQQEEGPAPVSGDVRASGAKEITDAVEGYGGFTYAR